jgi:hypothetical protein
VHLQDLSVDKLVSDLSGIIARNELIMVTDSIIDPNDFPALGAHPNSSYSAGTTSQPSQPPGMYLSQGLAPPPPPPGIGSSNGAQQQQQHQQLQQSQQGSSQANGSITGDSDFPALGGMSSAISGIAEEGKDRVSQRY